MPIFFVKWPMQIIGKLADNRCTSSWHVADNMMIKN